MDSPVLTAVRRWYCGFQDPREIAALFRSKDRDFRPIPFDGPMTGPTTQVIALAADRNGVVALDSGGGTTSFTWTQVAKGSNA